MLVGRDREVARLRRLVADLRAGNGRAVVLRGEPGVGKTALLEVVCRSAQRDISILRTRGVESEAEIAFSALSDLFGPLHGDLPSLPAPQSAALRAALALTPARSGDRLAVCVATVGLLRVAAMRGPPILVVADDLQWIDASSRECLLFAARRIGGDVAFLLAAREDEIAPETPADIDEILVGPLSGRASLALLGRAAPDLATAATRAVVAAAAGNPLALVELPRALSEDQCVGRQPIVEPLAPGRRLQAVFGARVAALPADAREALLVAAAYEGTDLRVIGDACERAGRSVTTLTVAEERGLVSRNEGNLAFSHPLIRSAAYHSARPEDRRRAHRALAEVLRGERRAWHLAASAPGLDEEAASALEAAGSAAVERRGFGPASRALERAARLSPRTDDCARRLLAAGTHARAAGLAGRAESLASEAADLASDGPTHTQARHLLGLGMLWSDRGAAGVSVLVDEAGAVRATDPPAAAAMLADAAVGCVALGDCRRAHQLADQGAATLGERGDPSVRAHVLGALALILAMCGGNVRASVMLERVEALSDAFDPLSLAGRARVRALTARLVRGDLERARDEAAAIAADVREAGVLDALYNPLVTLADACHLLGDWTAASAAAREAIELARDGGARRPRPFSTLARIVAASGEAEEGRSLIARGLAVAADEFRSGLPLLHASLGFLELGLERVDEAIAELRQAEALAEAAGIREPTLLPFAPDLVEALVRAGQIDAASQAIGTVTYQAEATPSPWADAALARCEALIADDFDPLFARALAHHGRAGMPFERARTLLGYGRRLHRARRRAEARQRLREAQAVFDDLGAVTWTAQVAGELRAAGARRRRSRADGLTPAELRVASAVAGGGTNKQIAAELFLSPRTVEFHLAQIFRKLGVRSRTQLVAALSHSRAAPGSEGPGADPT